MKKFIAMVTAFVVAISLTSCGGPSPTDVTTTFLDGIKELNPETISSVYNQEADDKEKDQESIFDEEDQQMLDRLKKDPLNKMLAFDYELSNEQIKDDKATVDVSVTTYDLAEPYQNFMKKFFVLALGMEEDISDEEMTDKMLTLLESEIRPLKEKTYKKTATIDLVKVEDEWKISPIDENKDLINALTGGLLDLTEATESLFN